MFSYLCNPLFDLNSFNIYLFRKVDLILEVAHISVTKEFGAQFLEHANFMVRTYLYFIRVFKSLTDIDVNKFCSSCLIGAKESVL